jgi:beta-galactosidase
MKRPLLPLLILLFVSSLILSACNYSGGNSSSANTVVDLSGPGWKLWHDKTAAWEKDELYLPPVDLTKIPTNAPTGGWEALDTAPDSLPVTVPGTAEEYLGKGQGVESMVRGVTWWFRDFVVPADASGKKIRLLFDSVRQRAEIYANGKLVSYDLVGNTPFEADLTGVVKPGEKVRLAVRVTNPDGNFDWKDYDPMHWGKYLLPMSHGFSGVTGKVRLAVTDPVYLDDLYVQNTPAKTAVNVIATVKNSTDHAAGGSAEIYVSEKGSGRNVFTKNLTGLDFKPGETEVSCPVSVPDAKIWDLDHPNLYEAKVTIKADSGLADATSKTFGFRWFSPEGIGSDAMVRLNGKRIVLRTAISWGFWPINGIFPSPELAAKQVTTAKAYGLNMLNFHRCIGNPIGFEKADEMGLLYFEEPGGYQSAWEDPFAQALSREKLPRMVKRDRSHPSLIIYNMVNELRQSEKLPEVYRQDIQLAHSLDPSRVILYCSSWAKNDYSVEEPSKMHMLPFDKTVYLKGWWDHHRATGPITSGWSQSFYQSPTKHYGFSKDTKEVVYWGEEGAVSSPPRLGLIQKSLEGVTNLGWDGQVYRDWYNSFDAYLSSNNLRTLFPTVDDLCQALSVPSIEHQGRKIEDTRICNVNDGYAVNGWEAELIENHSGTVDEFRNPKADPKILAHYNQPLYIAVKPRLQIVRLGDPVPVDFHLINERDVKGAFSLKIKASKADGSTGFETNLPVTVTGGDVYAELLAEGVSIPVTSAGFTSIEAALVPRDKATNSSVAVTGNDRVLAVDWKSLPVTGHGAVLEKDGRIHDFLKTSKGIDVPEFDDAQGQLDWIAASRPPLDVQEIIPRENLLQPDGKDRGLVITFYAGEDFSHEIHRNRGGSAVDFHVTSGATPSAFVPLTENYSMTWEGSIEPPASGDFQITLKGKSTRLWINGKEVLSNPDSAKNAEGNCIVTLTKGKTLPLRLQLTQHQGDVDVQLLWKSMSVEKVKQEQLLKRVSRDGTTLVVLDRADTWLGSIARATGMPAGTFFKLGRNWVGGQYFVKDHPLFAGLPVNQALNWPYQGVLGGSRMAFTIPGSELVAGAYNSWPMNLGAGVAIVPLGKGKIILSTLDISMQLVNPSPEADVARRLLCNYLNAGTSSAK